MRDSLDFHISDLYFDILSFLFIFPLYGQRYEIFITVTDHGSDVGSFFFCDICSIDRFDHVSGFQTCLFSRSAFIELHDLCPSAILFLENCPDSHVGTFIGSIQFFILFCRVIRGVWILQSGEQTCIKALPQTAFILFILIFCIDQFFQIIQLLDCFHV